MQDSVPALKAEFLAAVDDAYQGGEVCKASLVATFVAKGGKPATLYRWIDRRLTELAAGVAVRRATLRDAAERKGPRMDAALAALPPMADEALPFMSLFRNNLRELTAILGMAKTGDGKVRNPRLAQSVVDSIGKQLALAARVQAVVDLRQRHEQFMQGLVDIVLREEPAVRDRIVAKMQVLCARYRGTEAAHRHSPTAEG